MTFGKYNFKKLQVWPEIIESVFRPPLRASPGSGRLPSSPWVRPATKSWASSTLTSTLTFAARTSVWKTSSMENFRLWPTPSTSSSTRTASWSSTRSSRRFGRRSRGSSSRWWTTLSQNFRLTTSWRSCPRPEPDLAPDRFPKSGPEVFSLEDVERISEKSRFLFFRNLQQKPPPDIMSNFNYLEWF